MSTSLPSTTDPPIIHGGGDQKIKASAEEVMERALSSARVDENYSFNQQIDFHAIRDHILPSRCTHINGSTTCQVCLYKNELKLPELPEMVFPNNKLIIKLTKSDNFLVEFNTFDALKRVDHKNLPHVEVGASAAWKEARKDHLESTGISTPFDWTFTSDYTGTLGPNVRTEDTDMKIDIEKLKRRDPIFFYTNVTLYEDELADHGCAMMQIRVRVMPTTFFVLCRFYLRIDHVMVRVCDTRLFGETGQDFILREWSLREAKYSELGPTELENVTDPNIIWQMLPILESKSSKIFLKQ